MTLFFIISFGLIITYIFLLLQITKGWESVTINQDNTPPDAYPMATVIIAARNEEANIGNCLTSILNNTIPHDQYEIVVVDDHSSDRTTEIITRDFPQIGIISLKDRQGKKSAIDAAVSVANSNLCIVTDADCTVSPGWIRSHLNTYISKNTVFQTGPVISKYSATILSAFQFLDFAALSQVVANGIHRESYFISNGANMAFTRQAYLDVGGMTSHVHIASGDDMFLIDSLSRAFPGRVAYIKDDNATCITEDVKKWPQFLNQRKRWASKVKRLPKSGSYFIQSMIFIVHLLIVSHLILIPFFGGLTLFTGIFLLFIKAVIDYLFLGVSCDFFNNRSPLKYFFFVFLLYFPYIIFTAYHGLMGSKYEWKGREGI